MERAVTLVKPKYAVRLKWDPDYEGYVASVVELPGCYSQGKTEDEALRNIQEAIELHVECLIERGKPVPEPMGATHLVEAPEPVSSK